MNTHETSSIRRSSFSLRRFGLALVLCMSGIGLVVGSNVWFWTSVVLTKDHLVQTAVPSQVAVNFDTSGEFEVVFETRGTFNGAPYRATIPSTEPVVMLRDAGGGIIALQRPMIRSTYSVFGSEGRTIGVLAVPAPGPATLTVTDSNPASPSGGTVIIERPFRFTALIVLLACVVTGGVSFVAGLALAVVRLVRRETA